MLSYQSIGKNQPITDHTEINFVSIFSNDKVILNHTIPENTEHKC